MCRCCAESSAPTRACNSIADGTSECAHYSYFGPLMTLIIFSAVIGRSPRQSADMRTANHARSAFALNRQRISLLP